MDSEPILYAHVRETPQLRGRVTVYLDGNQLNRCIWADVAKGCAESIVCDDSGKPCLDSTGHDIQKQMHYGVVRIERIEKREAV